MNIREVKAFTDIITSIRDAANNATTEKYALALERYAVQIEKLQLQVERDHAAEIDNLKARHSQAIDDDRKKHVSAIGDLQSRSANQIDALKAQNAELESQLASQRKQPPAVFIARIGAYVDESTDTHYCPKCWSRDKWSPMQETRGGYTFFVQCPVCDKVCNDPDRKVSQED